MDSKNEWNKVVKRLEKHQLSEINVFVDMKVVRKVCKLVKHYGGQACIDNGDEVSGLDGQEADQAPSVCASCISHS